LIVISLSLIHIVLFNVGRAGRLKRQGYQRVSADDLHENTAAHHTDIPPPEHTSDTEEDEEGLHINGGRLALVKTTTKGSLVQADVPPAETLSVVVEELAIIGLIAVNVIALVYGAFGPHGHLAAIVGITTWVYVLILASLRLFLGHSKWRVPRIWNHTASIYGCQWLFVVAIFRSVLVRPSSRLAQILLIVEFSLTSLLFGMALTTRKGNKTVILEWEDGIEPSREPLASLFSLATFAWVDAIIWQGYKTDFEMDKVWNLLPKDKAAAVLADYRQLKRSSKLWLHLLRYFKGKLVFQCSMAAISGLFTFAPTLLLKSILEYVENPKDAPLNVLWLYVMLLPALDVFRSFADGMALWTGRKICINIRAIMIGEIYAKALRRKAASGKDKVLLDDKKKAKDADNTEKETVFGKLKRKLGLAKKKADDQPNRAANDQQQEDASAPAKDDAKKSESDDEQANLGTIINLMSVDTFKISEVTAYLHFLAASAPVQLTLAIALLWRVLGWSAIPGLIVMIFLIPINYGFAKGFTATTKNILAATDKRINTTNEVLQNIRIIKYFAWEARFGRIVDEKRSAELKALRSRYILWAFAVGVWNSVPLFIAFFSFLMYTMVEGKPLYPSVAFTAISLFMLLRIPLDQIGDMFAQLQSTAVSIDRVEEFLMEDETEKYEQLGLDNVDENGDKVIGFRDKATFIWGGKNAVAEDGSMAFRLLDIEVDFQIGKLNIIAGPTGSGKTSMLMALLGEMTIMNGKVYCPGGRSREDIRPDPATGLGDTVAYVAQSAWLMNATIKENILFSASYDEQRYKDVIVACALERDLEILDNGDDTLVGEKGITLSGGQKQRISLARAVYSNSQHLLLDDCLSAVDSHTAQWIFKNCMKGPLMKDRTCILVSHHIQLCVPPSDYVVLLDNGRVSAQGPSKEMIASGKLGEEIQKSRPASAEVSRVPSRVPSSVGEESADTAVDPESGNTEPTKAKKSKVPPAEETKATGAVKWPVFQLYLSAMGSWWFWLVCSAVFGLQQLSGVASNVWIREWANQYITEEVPRIDFSSASHSYKTQTIAPTYFASIANYANYVTPGNWRHNSTSGAAGVSTIPDVNVSYYLTVLALIGIAGAISAFVRDLWLFYGSLTASRRIHTRLMVAVTRAKFKFFDVTPLGQLMNRFSKDLEAIDQEVAPVAVGVLSCALGLIVTIVLIAIITPGFLGAGVVITIAYCFVGGFYLRASRDLKRLESVQRSPLFQQFGETLSGMTTIRAYGDERRFIRENLAKINAQARPFIYLWACNRWLAFRADLLGNGVAFAAGIFIILSLGEIDAGAAGISLSYAIGFTEYMLWMVRLYAMNEQNMNSVERIKEYLEVEQEADAVVEKYRPAANWPSHGSVEFIDYSTRYRKEMEPVLRNITFKINPHEKVGIVGRTGAGKSSLALALFRALEADSGKILIDDVDVSQIGLQDLREGITIVPQDPTLFMGTLRSNLDPFDMYTDEQIFEALRRVHLIGADEPSSVPPTPTAAVIPPTPTLIITDVPAGGDGATTPSSPIATNKNIFLDLSSPVSESGSNLSQGQRQLVCLARALLRNPNVLVMDEATASIDYATDAKIQATIRELTSTIITIAHRLQTIVDYDKVLVLDKGSVMEFDHPYKLIQKEKGIFKGMCESSGEFDSLLQASKKAWEGARLVEVDDE
jgi:ABC-type multidrug transport system fused ATPase/permease subunit